MLNQIGPKIMSSFLLYVDHTILSAGQAFTNYSGLLYPISSQFAGFNTYSTPFRQLVSDVSVTGANIMSGIYSGSVFITPGASGLSGIDINNGLALFSVLASNISGRYAVKDFNIYLNDRPEETLLFETKLYLRPKTPQTLTGLPQTVETYPCIYLRQTTSEPVSLCFGNVNNYVTNIRATILADSKYSLDNVRSFLETNMKMQKFKLIDYTALPFNNFGAYTGVNYNYNNLAAQSSLESCIWRVRGSDLRSAQALNNLNPAVFAAFVDFEISTIAG